MKYPSHIYAHALAEVVADPKARNSDEIVARFIAIVQRNGDMPHLRKIVEEAARFARGKGGIRKVTIESARMLTAKQEKEVAHFLTAGDVTERKIDPSLIAGIRLIVDDEMQFDGSLRGKLDNVFRNI